MPTIETSIWLALKARVETLSLTPARPIAWPNEATPQAGIYLRVSHVPNVVTRRQVGTEGAHDRIGLLLIDVFEKKDRDAAVATEVAGLVAEHFRTDLDLRYGDITVRISAAPSTAQALATDTHWQVPVTIPYRVFA